MTLFKMVASLLIEGLVSRNTIVTREQAGHLDNFKFLSVPGTESMAPDGMMIYVPGPHVNNAQAHAPLGSSVFSVSWV